MSDLMYALHWRDVVDLLLLVFVAYRILAVFRGTRAVQMLIGLSGVILVTLAARGLDLVPHGWILDNFWTFWVFAFIVLFQPELRRALTRLGQGRLVQGLIGRSRQERAHVVDEIVTATEVLAGRRTGALIVLERGTGLRQYAELGVGLDAVVTADLLITIFLPPSPLHDGAVLIQGSRLVAAACFLPLSRSFHPGRPLGSRHRAALGITEETDAVALTVSEETGRVSLAVEGAFEAVADMSELRRRLNEHLGGAPATEGRGSLLRGVRRILLRANPGRAE